MTGNTTGFDRDDDGSDLRDPALRCALDHAPDSDARPDPRTRDAILKMAHNLAPAPAATRPAANSASAAPWWRRVFGGGRGEPRSRMPWNAAFATVLVATFVTVLWHREPVPDAQLDGKARVAEAAAPVQAPAAPVALPAQPSAEVAPSNEAPVAAAAPQPAPPPPQVAARKAPAAEPQQSAKVLRDSSSRKALDSAGADAVRRAAPPPSVQQAAPAIAIASDERREERVESDRRRAYAIEAPAGAAPPPAPVAAPPAITAPAPAIAAAPPYQATQDAASAFGGQGSTGAEASGALRSAAPRAAAAAKVARPQAPASFSALDRWTSFSFAGSGADVRHARGDIEGLPALVGTVARSATTPDEPLAAPVDARLSLYRGDTLVATLELAGSQVRWTPQPGGAARVGTPPAPTLDALRSLLTR